MKNFLLLLIFSFTGIFAQAQYIYDGSNHQIGRVDNNYLYDGSNHQVGRIDGNYIYDGSNHQIGRVDGLTRRQIIIFFYFFL